MECVDRNEQECYVGLSGSEPGLLSGQLSLPSHVYATILDIFGTSVRRSIGWRLCGRLLAMT